MITKIITNISRIKFEKAFLKLMATCAVGMLLNVIGVIIVKEFNLPIYLDTIGTIFISALGGYVPGIAVGFLTNLFGALFDAEEIYYGLVSVLLAIITKISKNYFDNPLDDFYHKFFRHIY